jgi:flagellar motor switch protein FliM
MHEAWLPITMFQFAVQATETEPQMLQLLAPNEAVVAISMEIRIGDAVGLMNIGIPSIIIKMLRQKFDQQWSMKKADSSLADQQRTLNLIGGASLYLDVRLRGATVSTADLLAAKVGDVLKLDWTIEKQPHLEINGVDKFAGVIVERGSKRCFRLEAPLSSGVRLPRRS